jgi:hypothetical protein
LFFCFYKSLKQNSKNARHDDIIEYTMSLFEKLADMVHNIALKAEDYEE